MVKMKLFARASHKPSLPIIVYGVTNIRPLQDILQEIVGNMYSMKLLANDKVEIQLDEKNNLGSFLASLKSKNIIFEVNRKKRNETFKVVLRNMHPSVGVEEIAKELRAHGHKAVNVSNMKDSVTNEPTPLFFIELERRRNNERIFSLTRLSNMIVTFEPASQNKASFYSKNSQSFECNDTSSNEAASGAKKPEKEAPSSSQSAVKSESTFTADAPIAYVQPVCSKTSKHRRQNTSASAPTSASTSASTSTFSERYLSANFTVEEQLRTLNRLANLESIINSSLSSMESSLLLTAAIIQRLNCHQ